MPSSLNALLAAWAATLIIVVGGFLAIELSYDPEAEHMPAAREEEQSDTPENSEPDHDRGHDTDHVKAAEPAHEETSPMPKGMDNFKMPETKVADSHTSLADHDMPAPGQVEEDNSPTDALQIAPAGLPVQADPALLEKSDQGMLPRISEDGKQPYEFYAAPFTTDSKTPRIAIIMGELGLRSRATQRALAELPADVTLAFSPYAANLIDWGERAREDGHEVLLMVPMEPVNYPQNDPGPLSLLTSQSSRENINLLKSSMGRLTGYVGVINHMGSRFTAASDSMRPVLDELKKRGLMFVDSRSTRYSRAATMARGMGLPVAYNNRYIDDELATDKINEELAALETRARTHGSAVGIARPYPVSINAIKVWAASLKQKGFALVPITGIADRQPPIN